MGKFRIEIKRSAVKELRKISSADLKRIVAKIGSLAEDPRPADSIKLSADEKYRLRCGDYRILYLIEDQVLIVYVIKVGHRKDVYRS